MRISTAYQYESYANGVAKSQARYLEAERQVSSGRRLNKPSDDPAGSSAVLSYRSLRSGIEQYSKNLSMSKGFLGFTETALTDAAGIVRRGYELALQGANGATDQKGREAMVQEVVQLQRRLLDVANARGPGGQYLFAGQRIDQKPFTEGGGTLAYSGDDLRVLVEISATETMPLNTQGSALFSDAYRQLEELKTRLMGGDTGALSGISVGDLQRSLDNLHLARGQVGVKLQTVQQLTDNYARTMDEFSKNISDIEEVDLTEAILKYRQAETAYSAAMMVASQGFRLSLMDFIRG